MNKEIRQELINAIEALKKSGYTKTIITPEESRYVYAFITTPSDNVLYIQRGDFGGWTFSLQYEPSKGTGSGCACFDEAVFNLDLSTIQKAETEGINFARRLKAKMYKASDEFYSNYWDKKMINI